MIGLEAVLANMSRIGAQIIEGGSEALAAGAETIRAAWVNNIESEGLVDTGHYRDSVHVQRDGPMVGVVTDVDYAGILEFGDSRQAPHPVAERAFDEHHGEATDAVARRLEKVIR